MSATNHCYEVVTCRGRKELSREKVISALQSVRPWLVAQPGFIERRLLEADDGSFVDFVIWESAELAHRAAEGFGAAPCAKDVMAVLDDASVRIFHARQVGGLG